MSARDGFIAVARFGLGARPGEIADAAGDPRGWLRRQVAAAPPPPAAFADLPSGAQRMGDYLTTRNQRGAAARKAAHESFLKTYADEAVARLTEQIETQSPFRERLVAFWSNHFTVSIQRPVVLGVAGAFEREAIRPYATARFADMLIAATRHPAMLNYLDNAQSVGPNSRTGLRRGRGLNENLAREILELHTLGVDGGYTQDDVREFARILTGWTVAATRDGDAGAFRFVSLIHEPGAKTLLGERYPERGENEGLAALNALARHPATARHIATKLARHFIADQPPADAVARLAEVYRDTDGDLGALAAALIDEPAAWTTPLTKLRTPNEFVVAALRAVGLRSPPQRLLASLRLFAQAPFAAPSPAGWADTADQWISPESVLRRAEWAMAFSLKVGAAVDPEALLDRTIGPVASTATRQAVARAPSAVDGMALLLSSPEFQRR